MDTQSAVDRTRALIEGKYSEIDLCDINTPKIDMNATDCLSVLAL